MPLKVYFAATIDPVPPVAVSVNDRLRRLLDFMPDRDRILYTVHTRRETPRDGRLAVGDEDLEPLHVPAVRTAAVQDPSPPFADADTDSSSIDTYDDEQPRPPAGRKVLTFNEKPGHNGYFGPCSPAILAAVPAHNNMQPSQRLASGQNAYIADYLTKQMGEIERTMTLIKDAIETSIQKPSQHPDLLTNPLRPAMRLLARCINNETKLSEIPANMIAASLIGKAQFESSRLFSRSLR